MAISESRRVEWGRQLIHRITCPTCWHTFPPEEVHFVSRHPEFIGDPVLGTNEYLRFLPSRFTHKGEAIDGHGVSTSQLACPRCHLNISEALLEVPPLFTSIVGSPGSGKSYFLTAMTWGLRHLLPKGGLSFTDADPEANSAIMEYEQTLFMNATPDQPVAIRKTQTDDPRLHKTARIEGVDVRYPLPLQFTVWPMAEHPYADRPYSVGRVCVFYDNAGEDCLPGTEAASVSVVQHLAESGLIFVLFDPTQEPQFRQYCGDADPQVAMGLRPGADKGTTFIRQEMILKEATVRIRRYLGLSQSERIRKPLIVIVAKFDMLSECVGIPIDDEPYNKVNGGSSLRLDLGRVEKTSDAIRKLFMEACPEFVATAEGLSEIVRYIPVSSLGGSPTLVGKGEQGFYGICPKDIQPKWVTVPMMYCMSKWAKEVLRSSRKIR
ncbi:MAG: hypothetical protein GWP08_04605 [Nitrospiraceae bacterium]|nr:hypothetical protein [Nitrospiraceae bacterium]